MHVFRELGIDKLSLQPAGKLPSFEAIYTQQGGEQITE